MNLISQPSKNQLDEVLDWLNLENAEFGRHSNKIASSFRDNNLLLGEVGGQIIGYLVYSSDSGTIDLDLFEIHPDFIKSGFGKCFFDLIEEHFKSLNYKVIKLFCDPPEWEKFWNRMNFIKFPDGTGRPELTYYKPLIEVLEHADNAGENKLELWPSFVHYRENSTACFTWDITGNHKSILIPDFNDFHLRLTLNGIVRKCDRMKGFFNNNVVELYSFILIGDLNELSRM